MQNPSPHATETQTALDALRHLEVLQEERALASITGLVHDLDYIADLDDDIAASEHAYVGLAVTEIATLRAELGGPLLG
jgi:predicted hydrolase (HD superfamily)